LSSDSTKVLDATAAVFTADQDQVRVTVPTQATAPTTGLYYGAVFKDGTELLAIAVLEVTP
jgi:hypothetical protein